MRSWVMSEDLLAGRYYCSSPDLYEVQKPSNAWKLYNELYGQTFTRFEWAVVNAARSVYQKGIDDNPKLATLDGTSSRGGSNYLNGGHVEVRDDKDLYNTWVSYILSNKIIGANRDASSSHQSDDPQFEIIFDGFGCILFGTRNGGTWFQTEKHAFTSGAIDKIAHIGDWFYHKKSGNKQVGPRGYSCFSEKNNRALCASSLPQAVSTYVSHKKID